MLRGKTNVQIYMYNDNGDTYSGFRVHDLKACRVCLNLNSQKYDCLKKHFISISLNGHVYEYKFSFHHHAQCYAVLKHDFKI